MQNVAVTLDNEHNHDQPKADRRAAVIVPIVHVAKSGLSTRTAPLVDGE